jgi:predicted PhzF superfamily epimerase YddE/YHI9
MARLAFYCLTGISEDPVTGSAHTVLAPYWSALLNKVSFFARQVSAFLHVSSFESCTKQESQRGGSLKVWLADGKTFISGRAVTVTSGTINGVAFGKV